MNNDTPCASPDTCGEFCCGLCQDTSEPEAPTCDLENIELCEACQ